MWIGLFDRQNTFILIYCLIFIIFVNFLELFPILIVLPFISSFYFTCTFLPLVDFKRNFVLTLSMINLCNFSPFVVYCLIAGSDAVRVMIVKWLRPEDSQARLTLSRPTRVCIHRTSSFGVRFPLWPLAPYWLGRCQYNVTS